MLRNDAYIYLPKPKDSDGVEVTVEMLEMMKSMMLQKTMKLSKRVVMVAGMMSSLEGK